MAPPFRVGFANEIWPSQKIETCHRQKARQTLRQMIFDYNQKILDTMILHDTKHCEAKRMKALNPNIYSVGEKL